MVASTAGFLLLGLVGCCTSSHSVHISRSIYKGCTNALVLDNGLVQALVVPELGRVMRFNFVNAASPFWENDSLSGMEPESGQWRNFGGDKSWPAPESDWQKMTGRSWPPPLTFDGTPFEAGLVQGGVVLRSAIDTNYGIRMLREIKLLPGRPQMTIKTTFDKVEGPTTQIAVWTITQLKNPERILVPNDQPHQTASYVLLSKLPPPDLQAHSGVLSFTRDPKALHKIGCARGKLLWAGRDEVVLIESVPKAGAVYPDQNSSTEIYTNPDPDAYVELEMLGPLQWMAVGDKAELKVTYSLVHACKRGER